MIFLPSLFLLLLLRVLLIFSLKPDALFQNCYKHVMIGCMHNLKLIGLPCVDVERRRLQDFGRNKTTEQKITVKSGKSLL